MEDTPSASLGEEPPVDASVMAEPAPAPAPPAADGRIGSGFEDFEEGEESGTEEEQALFVMELEKFFRERNMEFKPPKFYSIEINCLKLWREVVKIGGHDRVTVGKLWREVGRTFRPPKTCTTLSWTFRNFYEKALLDYEKHKISTGELQFPPCDLTDFANQLDRKLNPTITGKARKDAATLPRWQTSNKVRNGQTSDLSLKDEMEKPSKSIGSNKRKKESRLAYSEEPSFGKSPKSHDGTHIDDVGPPADWVRINVRKTKGYYEVYALVPGLLREELQVQSDQAGRLILTGRPDQPDNPWGVTPFKKVITFPSCIDPHETSAIVSLHGQLFVRAPIRQSD